MSIVARGLGHPGGLVTSFGLGKAVSVNVYNLTGSTDIFFSQIALTGLPGPLRRLTISALANPAYNLEMVVRPHYEILGES